MPFVATIAALAALVWGVVYARRGSLLVACLATLVVGYVFGYWFWHADLGPLPLTLDRLALVGLLAVVLAKFAMDQLAGRGLCGADWLLGGLLALVTVSAVLAGTPELGPDVPSPRWRLVASFWFPAILYIAVRRSQFSPQIVKTFLAGMTLLGVYLAATALAEVAGQWWAVFPRYIADPKLGEHFGRARGPALNSASLGVYLTVCIWCAWSLLGHVNRAVQLALLAAMPLMAAAVYLTYTRSTWLGLALSAFVMLWLSVPRQWRLPMVSATALAAVVMAAIAWNQIVGLEREGSAGDSQHSVQQRTAFAYVSWQMFCEHPIWGVGFGRFYDQKLPYLSERSQSFELESIRPLHHHNTFLGFLTETGMVGIAVVTALVVAWARCAWRLAYLGNAPSWVRSFGLLMIAVLVTYLPTAVFHDITHSHHEIWLLAVVAGATIGLQQAFVGTPSPSAATATAARPTSYGLATS